MITQERLKSLLSYDPETGVFRWLAKPSPYASKMTVGSRAGCQDGKRYRVLAIDQVTYGEHRLAWFYVYGTWPEEQIDHINGNKSDNRISNLRIATAGENQRNRGAMKSNTTGFKGVTFEANRNKYKAAITHNHKCYNLGRFDTAEEAHLVYCRAADRLHRDFARVS